MDTKSTLKILSLNLHGLAQPARTRRILIELANSCYDIILAQETHIHTKEQISSAKTIWKGKSIWDPGSHNSSGVTILFRPNLPIEIVNTKISGSGRFIIADCKLNDENIRLINIYAPVKKGERNQFFAQLTDILPSNRPTILGGDFNFVEDPALDLKGGSAGHGASSRPIFKALIQNTNLIDSYRYLQPLGTDTTFFSHPRNSHARLDRIYIDTPSVNRIRSVSHPAFTFSDHKAVLLTLDSPSPRGPGYWKCNIRVLNDLHFQDDFLRLWERLVDEKANFTPTEWWDHCKLAIRKLIVTHATRLACNRRSKLGDINRQINKLKSRRSYDVNSPDPLISQLEAEKNAILDNEYEGARIRSRAVHLDSTDKPLAHFLNIEKRNATKKTINKLIDDQGKVLDTIPDILNHCRDYYADLLSKKPVDHSVWEGLMANHTPPRRIGTKSL
jgi:exonuclease III